ncbi:MAG: hypothetical protein NTY83_01270, partial [Candidatus Micrarchaeota archaeon]|nr:hypothetical protein [Candidatus Micrarchaeota archaeon]
MANQNQPREPVRITRAGSEKRAARKRGGIGKVVKPKKPEPEMGAHLHARKSRKISPEEKQALNTKL